MKRTRSQVDLVVSSIRTIQPKIQKNSIDEFFGFNVALSNNSQIKDVYSKHGSKNVAQWLYVNQIFDHDDYYVASISFDPKGRFFASASDRKVRLFDQETQIESVVWSHGLVSSVRFDSTGRFFVAALQYCEPYIFDLITHKRSVLLNCGYARSLCFDPTGKFLAKGTGIGSISILDIATQNESVIFNCNEVVYSVCFCPTGKYIAAVTDNGSAYIIDIVKQDAFIVFNNRQEYVHSVCFDSLGNRLAAGFRDGRVRMFNIETQDEIMEFQQGKSVYSVCFDPAGKRLATGSSDGKARIFDLRTQQEYTIFNGNYFVKSVCFDFTGERLAVESHDCKARILNWFKKQTLHQIMLKKIINLWLQVQKPNKKIINIDQLFADIMQLFVIKNEKTEALLFQLDREELQLVWKTFPVNMQQAIWETVAKRIGTYGK
jgi:WD40 repeat protein